MSDYPEHDKMNAMRTELDAIASFLESLETGALTYGGRQLELAVRSDGARLTSADPSIPDLLAQWSGLDQNTLEAEKRAMLKKCQEMAP